MGLNRPDADGLLQILRESNPQKS